jgi:hypothetical protein
MIGLWGLALGGALVLLSPLLRYLAHEVPPTTPDAKK